MGGWSGLDLTSAAEAGLISNVGDLLGKLGVKVESIKSSPLKAAPNGMEPTSEAARDAIAALIADSFTWFKNLVKERRQMSDEELDVLLQIGVRHLAHQVALADQPGLDQ